MASSRGRSGPRPSSWAFAAETAYRLIIVDDLCAVRRITQASVFPFASESVTRVERASWAR
jgi:hypothetical protein